MKHNHQRSNLDQPAVYQIKVVGRLDESWAEWFDGMTITTSRNDQGLTITILTGLVVDQVALHGLLARIRDLGLHLLSVECVEANNT